MKLWKSLLVGFGTYVVLTFGMNMLILGLAGTLGAYFASGISTIILTTFTGVEGFAPVGLELYGAFGSWIGYFQIDTVMSNIQGVVALLAPIIPGLTAAILAGKLGRSSKNGFFGMLLTGIIVSVVPIVMLFIEPLIVLAYTPTILAAFTLITVPWVAAIITSGWFVAILLGVYGILIGLFWGGLAAFFGRE